ncbi:MAG: M15 family metallopeptidase, partial [Actinomycetes bacterium]
AEQARARAEQMARARRIAEQRRKEAARRRAERLANGQPVLGQGGCEGGDVSGYSNGQIPESALCPLWGAAGHLLTAPAARGFTAMSKEYAADFGSPICVTDSYRSYEMQVELYEAKPDLAAVPGTSNHGWARAVDLCGGIESFGTVEHAWMKSHAPAYGWYHPDWARQGGGREEPWHWEYGG